MNAKQKAVKKLWIKALRSGKYRQGTNALCRRDGHKHLKYCCLGVLCDLAVKSGIATKGSYNEESNKASFEEDETNFLPKVVQDWAGLKDRTGKFNKGDYSNDLAILNDDGKSFKEIADIIEKEPEGLFV